MPGTLHAHHKYRLVSALADKDDKPIALEPHSLASTFRECAAREGVIIGYTSEADAAGFSLERNIDYRDMAEILGYTVDALTESMREQTPIYAISLSVHDAATNTSLTGVTANLNYRSAARTAAIPGLS